MTAATGKAFPCCNVHFSVREQNKRVSHIRIWPQTAEEEVHSLPVEEGEDGGETNTFYSNVIYTDIFIFRNTNACDQQPMQIYSQMQWYLHLFSMLGVNWLTPNLSNYIYLYVILTIFAD